MDPRRPRDELFYDPVSGFVFEPEYRQVIRVRVLRIPDPQQDGSSLAYVLVRVLERRQEAIPVSARHLVVPTPL